MRKKNKKKANEQTTDDSDKKSHTGPIDAKSRAKKGAPSRAEVWDAAMSILAECAMLNKGPNIVETVRLLSSVIDRMGEYRVKRWGTLRKLSVVQL